MIIQIRPIAYNIVSHMQLSHGQEPNISHLQEFGCIVYILIPLLKCMTMGPQRPQRKLGIYVGFEYLSIIKF